MGAGTFGPRCHVSEASSIDVMTPVVALVVDSITLAPTVMLSASEAQKRITAALVRSAQTDAKPIHVLVPGSTIEPTRKVQSWAEYRQTSNATWARPGVRVVRNLLRVAS